MIFFDNNYQIMAFCAAIIAGIFSYFTMILMINRYRKKKSEILRILTITIFFLATAVILDPLLFTIYRISGLNGSAFEFAVNIQTHLSFGSAGIANAFLVIFIVNVFLDNKYLWFSYIFIIIEISILPLGISFLLAGQDTLPILLIFLITSIMIYILQIIVADRLRKKLKKQEDPVAYQGILHLEGSAFFLIITFVMFIFQQVAVQTPEFVSAGLVQGENSIFPMLGWIFAGITCYYLYVGYLCPGWIKKRWEKKNRKKKTSKSHSRQDKEYHLTKIMPGFLIKPGFLKKTDLLN